MSVDFRAMVTQRIENFLSSKNFHLDPMHGADVGSKTVVIYSSPARKIAIYRSLTDGEVNCLVGKAGADAAKLDDGDQWTFLSSLLLRGREPSLQELLARVPNTPKSAGEQLDEIADALECHWEDVLRD